MNNDLEAGYLMELFNEPLYMVGYQLKEEALVETSPVMKHVELPVQKKEVPQVPVMPKLQTNTTKIAKKCILLFLSDEDTLSANELAFLTKIMTAAKLQANEYDCVNFKGITITDVASRYAFDKLVLFGVKIPNLELEQYKVTQVKSTQLLSVDALWMIESNVNFKKLLWEQLQKMFGLVK